MNFRAKKVVLSLSGKTRRQARKLGVEECLDVGLHRRHQPRERFRFAGSFESHVLIFVSVLREFAKVRT